MGIWEHVGKAALTVTASVGCAVLFGGAKAIDEATKIYKDYKKNPNIDVLDRSLSAAGESIKCGVVSAGKIAAEGCGQIYSDYQKEQAEEARLKEESYRKYEKYKQQIDSFDSYTIRSRIAGVTHENRQAYVKALSVGQYLGYCREKDNVYDSNAVSLSDGIHTIGYIKAEISEEVAYALDNNKKINIKVDKKFDGTNGFNNGAEILITIEGTQPKQFVRNTSNIKTGIGLAAAGATAGFAAGRYKSPRRYDDDFDMDYETGGYDYREIEVDDEDRDYQIAREDGYFDDY